MHPLVLLLLLGAPSASAPDGSAIWTKRCAGCHGDDGRADTKEGRKRKIADFTQPAWGQEWTFGKVKATVEDGVEKKMPAWKDRLSAQEIAAVSRFAMTFCVAASKEPSARQADPAIAPAR